ncbi:MAG: cyclase family protein [Bacteroidota bacterium]|nr:cyclase family protein [Bacteroidota bacterium]
MTIKYKQNIIDLTHTIGLNIPVWPSGSFSEKYSTVTITNYKTDGFYSRLLNIPEHFGTHIDAPAHGWEGKLTIDQIPLDNLIIPAVVISVQEKVMNNPDYALTVNDILEWEKRFGLIQNNSVVLMHSGWSNYWNEPKLYLNQDEKGVMHFPGFSEEAVKFLIDERNINGIGVETLSIDCGFSTDFPVHKILFEANKYALENLADIGKLPPLGATLIVAPLKLEGGSGSPVRVFAMCNK